MKKVALMVLACGASLLLAACAPVLDKSLMRESVKGVSFRMLRERPEEYKGRLFVLGGVIIKTRLTAENSQIEALQVPVDSSGYFSDQGPAEGRYFAVLPQDEGLLDPEVYRQGRGVTLAGRFVGLRKERIDEMDYVYPVFQIVQIYLWPRESAYSYPYPGYYYDPWYYPYPYFYGDFWWGYPFYPYYPYYPYYNHYRGYPPYRTFPPERNPLPERAPAPERSPAPAPQRH